MNLNDLYFKHQLSMIRACAAKSGLDKVFHQTIANTLGRQIENFQRTAGAGAASSWSMLRFDDMDRRAIPAS